MAGGPRPERPPLGPIGQAMFGPEQPTDTPATPFEGPTKALARARLLSANQTPERAKRIAALQQRTGYTSAFIGDNLDTLEAESKAPAFDPATFVRESPLVANWLAADPNRVALLGNDLTTMSTVERQMRGIAQGFRTGVEQVQMSRIGSRILQGTVTPEDRERLRRIEAEQQFAPDLGNEGFLGTMLPTAAQQVPIYAQSLVAGGKGAALGAAVGATVGLAGVVAGPEAVAPAVVAGARFGAKVGAGAMLYVQNAEMEASLAVIDYEKMRDANGTPLDPSTARGAALMAGAVNGAFESVADIVGAKLLPGARVLVSDLMRNPTTRDIFARYAKDVLTAAGTEGVTETMQELVTRMSGQFATAAQDGTLDATRVTEILSDPATWAQAGQAGVAGVQASLVLGGGAGGVSSALDMRRAVRAERVAQKLDRLVETVQTAPVTGDAPAEVEALLTELHQSGFESASFSAEDWRALWQSVTLPDGTTPDAREALLEVTGDATEYDHALATGGTFPIPTDKLLVRLMRTPELRAWAVEHARVGPYAMSKAEAATFREMLAQSMKDVAPATLPDATEANAATLEAAVREQLTAAGRSATEADAGAVLWREFYRSAASREGVDPTTLRDQMLAAVVAGPDAATAGGLEQAAFHGTPHIFDKFTTAKMGTGEGAQAYGWGLYFAENESVAAGYRKALSTPAVSQAEIDDALDGFDYFGQDSAMDALMYLLNNPDWEKEWNPSGESGGIVGVVRRFLASDAGGALYRVDIPDEAVARFLDWDKPLSQHAPEVLAALRGLGVPIVQEMLQPMEMGNTSGAAVYLALTGALRKPEAAPSWTSVSIDSDVRAWSAQEAASKALLAAGIPGIKFLDAGSRATGDGTRNLVVFDENLITITHRNGEPLTPAERATALEQATPSGPRGRFLASPDLTTARIELLATADRSTFLHESAHYFLALYRQLADQSPEIRADLDGLYAWLGAESGAVLTVEQEEQFARGFEKYLRDHESPSLELRSVFRRFRAWLTRIYAKWKSLGVTLTPEVVRLMDRMVATDEQVAFADAQLGPSATLFPDDPAIRQAHEDAVLAAREQLDRETLAVVFREEQAWWKERAAEVRQQVAAELNTDPAYRARAILEKGTMPDGTAPEGGNPLPQKLDKAAIVAMVGPDAAKAFKPFYRVTGGVTPDIAAGLLGFASGTDLLTALASTTTVAKRVAEETANRMREEYGDPLTDGTVDAKAMQAVHNASREAVLRLELAKMQELHPAQVKAALRKFGGRVPTSAQLRATAKQMVASRTVRSLRNGIEFQRSEVKAAREAIKAATNGDWEAAAAAKVREALSAALYRETQDALDAIDKAKDRFAKAFQSDDKIGKTRDLNYVNAARAVLAQVGYGRADQRPADYLKAVAQYDPEAHAELLGLLEAVPITRPDFRDLTVAEVAAVRDVFDALWLRAKGDRTVQVGEVTMQLDEAETLLSTQLDTLPASKVADAKVTGMSQGWDALYGTAALLARMESVVNVLDGGDFNGPFRATFWLPATKAAQAMREQLTGLYATYLKLLKGLGELSDAPIPAPQLATRTRDGKRAAFQWRGKMHLLGAMLHTGNASNLDKMLRGMGWDASEWDAMVRVYQANGTLTQADYEFLQGVWDLFEGTKPQAQAVFKRLYGHYFEEIEAAPVATPWGDYRGGYVPALRDPDLVEDAAARQQARELETGITPEAFPTTGRGFTYGRTQAASPLLMDLRLIGTHLDAVMRFVHLEPITRPLARLTRRPGFKEALDRVIPKGATRVVNPFLMRFASQRTGQRGMLTAWDRVANRLRRGATGSFLYGNVANAVQNIVGVFPLLAKVPPKQVVRALVTYAWSPKQTAKAATDASTFMRQSQHDQMLTILRDIRDRIEPASAFTSAKDFLYANGFVMSRMTQSAMDLIAWTAGYNEAVAQQMPHEQAVQFADSIVRTTQSAANAEDVAPYAVGSPTYQLAIMMSSYFNTQANLLGGEAATILASVGLKRSAGRLFYLYVFALALPAVLGDAVVKVMNGEGIDQPDDEEPWLVDLLQWLGLSQARYAAAMVPVVGPNAMAFVNAFNNKPYDDRITVSPAVSTVESGVRGATEVVKQAFTDEELSRRDIRDIFTAFSLVTDLPVGFVSRPLQYQFDVSTGAARPSGPVEYLRGLVTGRSPQ